MIRKTPIAMSVAAALSAISLNSVQAIAQDRATLEEVIVTASRRSESIQDIPLNISAVSGDAIKAQGFDSLTDIMRWVPGIHVVDQGARAADAIVVRGLNANPVTSSEALNNSGGDTVATYIGEIPLYVDLKLNDMERVEVLLGPQGTLYGAGTLGGAIRYIPNKPQFDEASVEVRGDLYQISDADDVSSDIGITLNMPISDTLAFRLNVDYLQDSGFIDYIYTVREPGVSNPDPDFSNPADVNANLRAVDDVNDEETLSARGAVRWTPTEKVDATLTYYYQNQDAGGRNVNSEDALGIGKYESGLRFVEPSERENQLLALEVTADLGFAELTSATGFSKYEESGSRDQTDLLITLEYGYEAFPSFVAFTQEDVDQTRFNQELRLVSTNDSALRWIAGVFYNKLETDSAESREFTPGYAEFLGGSRPDALEYFSVDIDETTEWAIFGELTYDITERWDVTFGGRYYDYEFEVQSAVDFPLANTVFGGAPPDAINLDFQTVGQDDSGTLFKFNTSYDFTDDVMGYFTYSEGYRIGAGNGVALCPPDLEPGAQVACAFPDEFDYEPDETQNYELGLRTTWLDQRLTLNGALYYIDWKDPQLASTTINASIPILVNGEGAISQGVELQFNWMILDSLTINGSYSYTNAELSEDAPDLISTVVPPGFASTTIFVDGQDGDRLPGSPEHKGSIFATYVQPVGEMDLSIRYGITAIGDVLTKTGARANGEALPGFAVHNMSASLDTNQWNITLYANNLLNKFAVTGVRDDTATLQSVADANGDTVTPRRYFNNVLQPRSVGVRATYRFDM